MFFFDEAPNRRASARPPVGTQLYVVREHLYYKPGRAGPLMEYVVCHGRVKGYIEGGYVQIVLVIENAGANNMGYPKLSDIGKKVFYTAREAALLAKAMTEDYERRWAWTERWRDIPLRRPWENLLKEDSNAVQGYKNPAGESAGSSL